MSRIQFIQQLNPEWADNICCFLMDYPEFKDYEHLIPLSPQFRIPYTNVNTLFQAILHYICAVGVRYSYAINQWQLIFPLINTENWEDIVENMEKMRDDTRIQNKKREIYYNLCEFMRANNLTHNTIKPADIDLLKQNVNGIGDGCVAWVKKFFTLDDDCVEYTDIYFKKGFKNIYGEETLGMRKKKAKEWVLKGYGRIANHMVINCS